MAAENRVQMMWNCATALESNSHTHRLLKSYYMNMCRKYAKNTLQIPKEKFSNIQMCSHCGCFWNESEFSMKLKPQQVAQKAKAKKLIENLDKSNETGQKTLLSKKQRKRAQWLQKRVDNYIQIKCELCKYKSLIKMEKPKTKHKKDKTGEELMDMEEIRAEDNTTTKTKKKRKNKNKSAGVKLSQPADNPQKLVTHMTNKPKAAQTHCQTQKSSAAVTNVNSQQKKSKKIKQKSTRGIESNANKIVSKTQQQNSLLQLAALLKQQTSSTTGDGKSAAQKRLESLLK